MTIVSTAVEHAPAVLARADLDEHLRLDLRQVTEGGSSLRSVVLCGSVGRRTRRGHYGPSGLCGCPAVVISHERISVVAYRGLDTGDSYGRGASAGRSSRPLGTKGQLPYRPPASRTGPLSWKSSPRPFGSAFAVGGLVTGSRGRRAPPSASPASSYRGSRGRGRSGLVPVDITLHAVAEPTRLGRPPWSRSPEGSADAVV